MAPTFAQVAAAGMLDSFDLFGGIHVDIPDMTLLYQADKFKEQQVSLTENGKAKINELDSETYLKLRAIAMRGYRVRPSTECREPWDDTPKFDDIDWIKEPVCPFRFLDLPKEIRLDILDLAFATYNLAVNRNANRVPLPATAQAGSSQLRTDTFDALLHRGHISICGSGAHDLVTTWFNELKIFDLKGNLTNSYNKIRHLDLPDFTFPDRNSLDVEKDFEFAKSCVNLETLSLTIGDESLVYRPDRYDPKLVCYKMKTLIRKFRLRQILRLQKLRRVNILLKRTREVQKNVSTGTQFDEITKVQDWLEKAFADSARFLEVSNVIEDSELQFFA